MKKKKNKKRIKYKQLLNVRYRRESVEGWRGSGCGDSTHRRERRRGSGRRIEGSRKTTSKGEFWSDRSRRRRGGRSEESHFMSNMGSWEGHSSERGKEVIVFIDCSFHHQLKCLPTIKVINPTCKRRRKEEREDIIKA